MFLLIMHFDGLMYWWFWCVSWWSMFSVEASKNTRQKLGVLCHQW